jgi:membrane-bound ClpP family serine protease
VSAKPQRSVPSGEHPLPERHAYPHDNRLLLVIIGVLFVALLAVSLVAYEQPKDNAVAVRMAVQLQQRLRQAGLPEPSVDVIVNSLGTDGGVVGKTSGLALPDAILNLQLTAGGEVAARPIPIDQNILNSELAIIYVYCPSRAAAFMKYFHEYKVYDLIKK